MRTGASNLRMRFTGPERCSSAPKAVLKKPSAISASVKALRSVARRLLISGCSVSAATTGVAMTGAVIRTGAATSMNPAVAAILIPAGFAKLLRAIKLLCAIQLRAIVVAATVQRHRQGSADGAGEL